MESSPPLPSSQPVTRPASVSPESSPPPLQPSQLQPNYYAAIPGEQPGLEVVPQAAPGLEVVPQGEPGLEVAPDTQGLEHYNPERDVKEAAFGVGGVHTPGVYQQDAYPEVWNGTGHDPDAALPAGAAAEKSGWSKKKWLIIGGIGLLVILAAILGGVFGSRAANKSGDGASADETTTATPSKPSSPDGTKTSSTGTPGPTSIERNSPLSAVSFVTTWDGSPAGPETGDVVVLAYRDQKGLPQAIISQVTYSQNTSDPWQASQLISPNPTQNGTGLGVAGHCQSYMRKTPRGRDLIEYSLHLDTFWVNETGYLNGVQYVVRAAAMGVESNEINNRQYAVRTGSKVAAYWPWVAFQDWSGFINIANALDPEEPYRNAQLPGEVGQQGTRLTVIPVSTDFEKVKNGSFGIFYQNSKGLLTPVLPARYIEGAGEATKSWPEIGKFPQITLPRQGSFTAFSFARDGGRKGGETDLVNTFVLYQDEEDEKNPGTGPIKQVWTDDSEKWQASTPKALLNADMGTDIACLTPATSNDTYAAAPLYLAGQSSLTRCYFQRGGWVVEVLQNGTDWTETGLVPLS
ncbi:hypothetical protein V8F20_000472 [Naviculisporaceae sp. PSN 640]